MPALGPRRTIGLCRKNESLITRLRIGHTPLTHVHLLRGEPPPVCDCGEEMTVEHILLHCKGHCDVRKKYFKVRNIHDLFSIVEHSSLIRYIREIGLYDQL